MVKLMKVLERVRLFFSGSQRVAPAILTPPAIVEEYKHERKYTAARPALPWSDDIKAHNHWVNAEWEQRRQYLVTGYTIGALALPDGFPAILAKRTAVERDKPSAVETVDEFDWRCRCLAIADLVEAQMWKESRNADATCQQPLQPLLTPQERQIAREWAAVKSEVDTIEEQRARRSERPSAAEILQAAGGNEERAAQLQAKVDELFGSETRP
jgi:hypothetical protein